jgi:hypothetical protein
MILKIESLIFHRSFGDVALPDNYCGMSIGMMSRPEIALHKSNQNDKNSIKNETAISDQSLTLREKARA